MNGFGTEVKWSEEVLFDVESRLTESNNENFSKEKFLRPEIEILTFWILLWSIIDLDYISLFTIAVFYSEMTGKTA
jgi:hypothetical protein